jgi:hypothetical protein
MTITILKSKTTRIEFTLLGKETKMPKQPRFFAQALIFNCISLTLSAAPQPSKGASPSMLQGGISSIWSPAELGLTYLKGKVKTVTDVVPESPAFDAGLRKDDVILRIDHNALQTGITFTRKGKKIFAKINTKNYSFKAETPKMASMSLTGNLEILTGDANIDDLFLTRMNPVPDKLRAGIKFDKSNLPACKCGGPWFVIPDWAPGVWASAPSKSTELWRYNYKTHKRDNRPILLNAKFLEPKTVGLIKDAEGHVWHHPCVPYEFNEQVESTIYHNQMIFAEAAPVQSNQLGFHWRWLSIQLDEKGIIKNVFQSESVAIFSRGGGLLEDAIQTVKTFDSDGNPLEAHQTKYSKMKIKDFEPVDKWFGYDVKEMFAEFQAGQK